MMKLRLRRRVVGIPPSTPNTSRTSPPLRSLLIEIKIPPPAGAEAND